MKIIVIAEVDMQKEFESKGIAEGIELHFETAYPKDSTADAYFYLMGESTLLQQSWISKTNTPVFVNAVATTLGSLPKNAIRMNAWKGFIKRPMVEVAFSEENASSADHVLSALQWQYRQVPDLPGMIAPKIISMLINEAYFALGDDVSTKEEIDTAMKLGTNYPYGPFEWSTIIGVENICSLLKVLSETNKDYTPAPLLINEHA